MSAHCVDCASFAHIHSILIIICFFFCFISLSFWLFHSDFGVFVLHIEFIPLKWKSQSKTKQKQSEIHKEHTKNTHTHSIHSRKQKASRYVDVVVVVGNDDFSFSFSFSRCLYPCGFLYVLCVELNFVCVVYVRHE